MSSIVPSSSYSAIRGQWRGRGGGASTLIVGTGFSANPARNFCAFALAATENSSIMTDRPQKSLACKISNHRLERSDGACLGPSRPSTSATIAQCAYGADRSCDIDNVRKNHVTISSSRSSSKCSPDQLSKAFQRVASGRGLYLER